MFHNGIITEQMNAGIKLSNQKLSMWFTTWAKIVKSTDVPDDRFPLTLNEKFSQPV